MSSTLRPETKKKVQEYRRLAAMLEERAKNARDDEAKRSYQEIAQEWRELADQIERSEWKH